MTPRKFQELLEDGGYIVTEGIDPDAKTKCLVVRTFRISEPHVLLISMLANLLGEEGAPPAGAERSINQTRELLPMFLNSGVRVEPTETGYDIFFPGITYTSPIR